MILHGITGLAVGVMEAKFTGVIFLVPWGSFIVFDKQIFRNKFCKANKN